MLLRAGGGGGGVWGGGCGEGGGGRGGGVWGGGCGEGGGGEGGRGGGGLVPGNVSEDWGGPGSSSFLAVHCFARDKGGFTFSFHGQQSGDCSVVSCTSYTSPPFM